MDGYVNHRWTDDEDAALKNMWGGKLSTKEIGTALSKTKSAVIGRAHRLGLPTLKGGPRKAPVELRVSESLPKGVQAMAVKRKHKRGSLGIAAPAKRTVEATNTHGSQPPKAFKATYVDCSASKVSIVDITPFQCRAVIDMPTQDDRAMMCGLPIVEQGCPWCAEHKAAYTMPYTRKAA